MEIGYDKACVFVISAIVLGLVGTANAIAESDDMTTKDNDDNLSNGAIENLEITVTGTGTIKTEPDQAVVKIGIVIDASTATESWQSVSETANKVLNALKNLGISDQNMETTDYNLQKRWDRHHEEILGFTCSYTLKIKVENLDSVGEVIDAAAEAGANEVYSIEFTQDEAKIKEAKRKAFQKAAEDARAKAEAIASAFDGKVIGIADIQVNNQSWNPWVYRSQDSGIRANASTPINSGDVEATNSLTVTYKIGWD